MALNPTDHSVLVIDDDSFNCYLLIYIFRFKCDSSRQTPITIMTTVIVHYDSIRYLMVLLILIMTGEYFVNAIDDNLQHDTSAAGFKLIKCYQCTGESPNCMETCLGKLCYRHEMEFGKDVEKVIKTGCQNSTDSRITIGSCTVDRSALPGSSDVERIETSCLCAEPLCNASASASSSTSFISLIMHLGLLLLLVLTVVD